MRQLTYVAPRRVEWREVPPPRLLSPSDALVRPVAVASCDLDIGIVRGRTPWRDAQLPMGHECVARVVETGEGVDAVELGDLVCVPYQVSCGSCTRCRSGLTANCSQYPGPQFYGFSETAAEWGGFLSDLVRVPHADHMLLPLHEGVDPVDAASVSDNITDGWRSVVPGLRRRPGADVLVVGGSGAIGLYAVAAGAAAGAGEVVYVDRDERRLQTAEQLGARVVAADENWHARPGQFPITVDASSTKEGLTLALLSTEPGGECTSTGMHFGETALPLYDVYLRDVTVRIGLINASAAMPEVLLLLAAGVLPVRAVVTAVAPWEEAPEAMSGVRAKTVFVRDAEAR